MFIAPSNSNLLVIALTSQRNAENCVVLTPNNSSIENSDLEYLVEIPFPLGYEVIKSTLMN